jgi:DNA invertase Pin-like site-specific DNA recombinase
MMLEGEVINMASKAIAGRWLRVSSGDQDEANQEPSIDKWIADHGYEVGPTYRLHGKSASKGKQQAKLDEMLSDMRAGRITVLVVWYSARIERRGAWDHFNLAHMVRDAGGRIEYVMEPWLNEVNAMSDAFLAMQAAANKQYTDTLSKNVLIAHDRIRANRGVYGAVPWGFDIVGEKYGKRIVPTELCKQVVPQIFERCIAGDSLRTIAAWLDSQGIPTSRGRAQWHETSVRFIVLSRAYAGRLQNRQGQTIARCEAVVPADVFDRANQALTSRPHRGPSNAENKPLLAKIKCNRCASPMYRIARRKQKEYVYYRCYGSGAQRKGCGNMIPGSDLEDVVHAWVTLTKDEPYESLEWVEGESYDSDISDVKQDIREAAEAEEFDRLPGLQAKLADLREKQGHATKGHYERIKTGETKGQHFHGLDYDGQREYLATLDIRAEKAPKLGDVPGVRLVTDGVDYGVIRLVRKGSRPGR